MAAFAGVSVALAGVMAMAAFPDRMLALAFDASIVKHGRPVAPHSGHAAAALADREGRLLRTSAQDLNVLSGRSFSVGDRIALQGKDGRDAAYDVVEVVDVDVPLARDRTVVGPRLLLVVARPVDSGPQARPLRFVVEADDADGIVTPAGTHRAL